MLPALLLSRLALLLQQPRPPGLPSTRALAQGDSYSQKYGPAGRTDRQAGRGLWRSQAARQPASVGRG
eukprot:10266900-Heterocapsa_arctica.AAC.1